MQEIPYRVHLPTHLPYRVLHQILSVWEMSRQMDSVGDRLAVGTGEVCVAVVFAKVGDEVCSTAIEDGLASRTLLDLV